jgi:hypothetical protein
MLANPAMSVYVEGWPGDGDFGLIAEEAGVAVGAAWYRFFSADAHGYGFIDKETPEIAVAVVPRCRARARNPGVGSVSRKALLQSASGGEQPISRGSSPSRSFRRPCAETAEMGTGFRGELCHVFSW